MGQFFFSFFESMGAQRFGQETVAGHLKRWMARVHQVRCRHQVYRVYTGFVSRKPKFEVLKVPRRGPRDRPIIGATLHLLRGLGH